MRFPLLLLALACPVLAGCNCATVLPPRSPLPNATAAIERMRATSACGTGIAATAKIDHQGSQGRIRGDLLILATRPASIRMDAFTPLGATIVTLSSDGTRFALADLRENAFLVGPATTCNIARMTNVPIPGHALVTLMRGEAPLLKHDPAAATIVWNSEGYYVVTVPSSRDAVEEIHLTPHPQDFDKPWQEQRMRVLEVTVRQKEWVLYRAELGDHAAAKMSDALVDKDDPTEPPIPPSGPQCTAEIPSKIHIEVPSQDDDVRFRYASIAWNPPINKGVFQQTKPDGMRLVPVQCE